MLRSGPLSWRIRFSYCIGPFIINAFFIVFAACSINTRRLNPVEPRNVIPIVGCFLVYIIDTLILAFYGIIMGDWSELLYGVNITCLSVAIILTWPVFWIFFLPFVIFRMIMWFGSPRSVWQRRFEGTGGSLELLRCEGHSVGLLIVRSVYIGLPFFVFALVYILFMIVLSPIWYFSFSPLGMGMYSVCVSVGFNIDEVRVTSINDRVARTYRWGMFFNVFLIALLYILCSACYIGIVGAHWWAVLLLILSLLYFIGCVVPTAKWMFCSRSKPTSDFQI